MKEVTETAEIIIPLEIQFPSKRTYEGEFERMQRKYADAANGLQSVSLEAINLENQRTEEHEQERIRLERQFLRD